MRRLPAVNEILNHPSLVSIRESCHPDLFLKVVRALVDEERQRLLSPQFTGEYQFDYSSLAEKVLGKVNEATRPSLRPVINATGIILHTGLGRAPLAEEAVAQMIKAAVSYSNLELDLGTGRRGNRYEHVEGLLKELTGAEAAMVVNNNAAAVLLALNSLAFGKEVIVSRGELVEIGGSFRLPEVMKRSGAALREVGTTNRTYLADYEEAIGPHTGLLLKVHTSNFRILGFACDVPLADLVALGLKYSLPVMEDLGSGCLTDLAPLGLGPEPTVRAAVQSGAGLVTFSGDKLLGGPQAGILVGKREYVTLAKDNPLNRAVRIDKLTLAALEATLRLYSEQNPLAKVPALRLLTVPLATIERRARRLNRLLIPGKERGLTARIEDDFSQVGGGALPLVNLPTKVVALFSSRNSAGKLEERLRSYEPPIIARVHEDQVLLDLRCVSDKEVPVIAEALLKFHPPQ